MRRGIVIAGMGIVCAVTLVSAAAGPFMSRIEQPPYKVERSDGAIEIRSYPAMTVATTVVEGTRSAAVNQGFRILADYIFGANDGSRKIEMTAPVLQEGRATGASNPSKVGNWSVRFVMPRAWPRDDLPKPRDRRVTLETVPATMFAAIGFSGFWRDALFKQKTAELEAFISRDGLHAKSGPVFAFYNPPWTLPFLRRNEVLIEVSTPPR